jgi:hypothetical protein
VSRNHCKHGVIRVICTDCFHHGEPGYEELGYHYIGTLRLAYRKGFADEGFRWHGPREVVDTIETRDRKVSMSLSALADPAPRAQLGRGRDGQAAWQTELPLPVKMWRTENDTFVWRFRCVGDRGCDRDVQRHDKYLAQIVTRWAEMKPDTPRVLLDITRL